jgi:general secretion pathway protein B
MSFILDALKKSEAERQRQAGPTLLEVRITRPHRRYPIWAAVLGALFGINAVVLVVVFMLRRPPVVPVEHAEPVATVPAPAMASTPVAHAAEAVAARNVAAASPGLAAGSDQGAHADVTPALAEETAANPADEQPAVPASRVQVERAGPGNYDHLPSISQLGGSVPALQLDLLDYSEQAAERYALINMHRVREGDVLPEGPRVLAITRDGVALNYRGQDFLLRPGGAAQ